MIKGVNGGGGGGGSSGGGGDGSGGGGGVCMPMRTRSVCLLCVEDNNDKEYFMNWKKEEDMGKVGEAKESDIDAEFM